ncbi:hypothetical protein VP1G_07141 [Cytospora mali]|uniref:Uncharacterized protein n=1 Tax=Cytospora mali TaxID=578113 RepID=A0A194V7J9_CYTMA|nr:hypothetical protein VP1G_07141 [Valsa mali var. pyri (nom. inval.)]
MSARNLAALGLSVGVGVITGVYIFRPALQEQHESNEFRRNPDHPKPENVFRDDKTTVQDRDVQAPKPSDQGK